MEFHTVVIGTGFSGLGMAIQLKKDGREDFVVLEKAADVGGTWRDNTYPGCACDIQSHMYSFSFEQNPRWSRSFSPQPEIWRYLRDVTDRYGLRRHIRFGVEVTSARWDPDEHRWHIGTSSADGTGDYTAKFLVSGIGGLHIPNVPKLPGVERFRGKAFHSAQWDHDYDLTGKRVAVVGTGASAIQFVPRIQPDVERLTIFQRTPPWIMPKPDHAMPGWVKTLFRRVPGAQRLYRDVIYWLLEARAIGFNGKPGLMKVASRIAKAHMHKAVKDPDLRRKLTPDYVMGCKRVLIANDYYPALTQDNVEVNTDGIREVTEHGIIDERGVAHEVDAIIYGTGFHVTDAFDYLDITGLGGRDLSKDWRDNGIQTHLGITVAGYPNLFFLLGPNTALGHNSVVFMIESQIRYVSQAMALVEQRGAQALDTRESAQARFQSDMQRKLVSGVWTQGGCKSWYLDSRGVNRTIWPGFTWRYWLRTRKLETQDFDVVG
ncbi:flavin-containing monooxygenase [Actinophytocola algeriensis]|uniref:Cation diffusion facilitator CzcD-associated flavoprotein CzcO n=1 Tax=Actinophytocola algeriensis TaxID=1768010 RepID=A0A7W7PZY7_9PSEU|nr:NAD(P)/FAD-dependent oxidoreductase [Actinophytocola algeriensis]MBB4904313.1 cation diffusion facilitator CzcD-associated flavoprotein CzcO [Actinophytocola algeriensis]MBE1476829.1 cation diffusion facilitator CzcD-associated flavoprotein CzcO [Actinophytocola algeriensis]